MGKLRKSVKIVLLVFVSLFFVSSIALFFFIHTGYLSTFFISFMNKQLSHKYDLVFNTSKVRGNLFGNLHFIDGSLSTLSDIELLKLEGLDIRYRLFSLLRKEIEIESISIDKLDLSYPLTFDTLMSVLRFKPKRETGIQVSLNQVDINSLTVFDSELPRDMILSSQSFSGRIELHPDSVIVIADTAYFELHQLGEELAFSRGSLLIVGDSLFIKTCKIENRSTESEICGLIKLDSILVGDLDIKIENLLLSERFPSLDKVFFKEDYLNFYGSLSASDNIFGSDLVFSGQIRGCDISNGRVEAEFRDDELNIRNFSFGSRGQSIFGHLNTDFVTGLTGEVGVEGFDLNRWQIFQTNTHLSGIILLEIDGAIDNPYELTARVKLRDSEVDTFGFDRIEGELHYKDGNFAICDTFFLVLGETILKVIGELNLSSGFIDGQCYFNSSDLSKFAGLLSIDSLQGDVEGFVEAKGDFKGPDLRGWVKGNQVGVPEIHFDEAIARFGAVNVDDELFGDIFIESINGESRYLKSPIPLASLVVRIESDTAYVRSLRIGGKDQNIEIKGSIVNLNDFYFDRVSALYKGNLLVNLEPIHLQLQQDTLKLNEVEFAANKGTIRVSASVVKRKLDYANLDIVDLSIDPLNVFIKGPQRVEGILSGNIEYFSPDGSPRLGGQISLEDVNFLSQKFDYLCLEVQVKDDRLLVNNFQILDTDSGLMKGSGYLSCSFPLKSNSPFLMEDDTVEIHLNFDNFQVGSFDPFLFPGIFKDGKLSGEVSITNSTGDPLIVYNLTARDPVFSRLKGDELIARGKYQNSKLQFIDLLLHDDGSLYKGYGYLPFNVSLVPGGIVFEKDQPMSMNFSASTSTLPFLTNYISDLEDVNGDFNLDLNLSGTPEFPVRSGNFTAKNATVYISSLENPVQGVEGSAVLENNVMDIVSFSGFMLKPGPRSTLGKAGSKIKAITWDVFFPPKVFEHGPNLSIVGTLDFTKFFDPYFNIRLDGKELYVRTLLAEQEGIVSGVLTMVGRDSVQIEGDIEVKEFVIRNEFTGSREMLEEERSGGTFRSISIHASLPGNFYFRNSQLDCELEGEMWIIHNTNEPYRYSGDLDVRKGKFFYYGNEFIIERGHISFEPFEFNPTLDIEAKINLASYGYQNYEESASEAEDEYVTVRLTGDFERPNLEFESDKYAQTDILMFLTRMQPAGDEFFSQEKFSSDAMNIFGAYFEQQLEKNISRISGLDAFDLRTKGNISSVSDIQLDRMSLILGRSITPDLFLKYERNLSLIDPDQQIGLEYRLNRSMSIVGDIDQNGLMRINYRYKYHY